MPPETFSSELRDVHERRPGDRDSFNEEFRGASDSLIEKERPPLVGGRGRGAVIAMALTLMLPLLIGGGIALWYWSVPIGRWLAGIEPEAEPTVEPEPAAPQPAPAPIPEPPAEPAVDKVFGIRGASEDNAAVPTPEPEQPNPPVQPEPGEQPNLPVQPNPPVSKIEAVSTNVRGAVGSTAVSAALDKLDPVLATCWAKAGGSAPVELELSFAIMLDGKLESVSLLGGSEPLHACVREALPSAGWPQPRAGEATVTRTWKLG